MNLNSLQVIFFKELTSVIFLVIFVSSCKVNKHAQIDYSNSAKEPIEYIKANILNDSVNKFKIRIINSHGGRYQINSQVKKKQDSVIVFSQIYDMSEKKSDTIFYFSISEFIAKLYYEIKYSENKIVIAGNYQLITINVENKENTFYTRRAFGIISLFANGKSNRIENLNN